MIRHIIEAYGIGAISIQQLFKPYREEPREIIDVEYEDLSDQIQQPSNAIEISNAELMSQTYSHSKSISEMERDIICSQMGIRFSAPDTILKINI